MIRFEIPIQTGSGLNDRMHHLARARKVKRERNAAYLIAVSAMRGKVVEFPAMVTITRLGSRALDDDNLAGACKAVRDSVADALRINDGGNNVRWVYAQEKCKRSQFGIRVTIEALL